MKHVMADLETMGLRPDAAIVSIGACCFDIAQITHKFHTAVSLADCTRLGLTTDKSTVDWWFKQTPEARSAWQRPDAPPLLEAMSEFTSWLRTLGSPESVAIWGNGAAFDPVLLESAYRALGADPYWRYYNVMCFRTLRNTFPDVSAPPFLGEKHNALDDAVHQAEHLQKILRLKNIALP
jgi:exodeoxyribonuclease VIII